MKKSVGSNGEGILKSWLKLLFFLYLFVLSIGMIKKASGVFAPSIKGYLFGNAWSGQGDERLPDALRRILGAARL